LASLGIFHVVAKAIQVLMDHFDTFSINGTLNRSKVIMSTIVLELNINLSLLFLLILANGDNDEFWDTFGTIVLMGSI
jgi:hypothetical protein